MGVWVLTGFEPSGRLVLEAALPSLTLAELRSAVHLPDDPLLGEVAVSVAMAPLITRDLPHVDLDFDRVAYRVREFSVGPELEQRDGVDLPPRHARGG